MDKNLHNLYEYILNLDFFNDILNDVQVNNLEVDKEENIEINDHINNNKIIEVPLDFINSQYYIKVWEPLFFLECKANILKSIQTEVEFLF